MVVWLISPRDDNKCMRTWVCKRVDDKDRVTKLIFTRTTIHNVDGLEMDRKREVGKRRAIFLWCCFSSILKLSLHGGVPTTDDIHRWFDPLDGLTDTLYRSRCPKPKAGCPCTPVAK